MHLQEQEHQSLQRLQQASDGQLHAQLIEQHKAAPASLDAGIIAQSNAVYVHYGFSLANVEDHVLVEMLPDSVT